MLLTHLAWLPNHVFCLPAPAPSRIGTERSADAPSVIGLIFSLIIIGFVAGSSPDWWYREP